MSPGTLSRTVGEKRKRLRTGWKGEEEDRVKDTVLTPQALFPWFFLARNYWLISERIKMKQNARFLTQL